MICDHDYSPEGGGGGGGSPNVIGASPGISMTCGALGSSPGDGDADGGGGGGGLGVVVGEGPGVVVGAGLVCAVPAGATPSISNRPFAVPVSVAEARSPSGAAIPHGTSRPPAIQLAGGTVL
jgi:hypothetical protein